MKPLFRNLTKDEIKVRVGVVTEKGCQLLLYKDARCDMDILDETCGSGNWMCKYSENKGNLFCSVGIRINNEWIWKEDCGVETYTEKQKGEASDAFKRACVRWGIGRELYTSPFIFVPVNRCRIKDKKCKDKFRVETIRYEGKSIVGLSILNDSIEGTAKDKRVFCLMPPEEKHGA